MSENEINDLNFEEAIAQLEAIKLDDAVLAYEKAVALKKLCENKLKDAQMKIEKIEIAPNGDLTSAPLDHVEE